MEINYSKEIPPIYIRCRDLFGASWDKGYVFTYGNTIYSKFGDDLTRDLKVHEETHVRQQEAMGKDKWWNLYFTNKEFRLKQEVEAYRNQIEFARVNYKRKYYEWLFDKLTTDMAVAYSGMCTKEEAIKLMQ